MKSITSSCIVVSLLFGSQMVAAASMKKSNPVSSSQGSSTGEKSTGRDWLISVPVMTERPQLRVHMEYNAGRSAGLALEIATIARTEELRDAEIQATGNSLVISGAQASLLLSRYSDEANLGGFFWTLGAGYRQWGAEWAKKADEKDVTRLGLVDDDGLLHHRIKGRGTTGHVRVGYRYVAKEWPIAVGAHVGLRHMNSQITEAKVSEAEEKKLEFSYSPVSGSEKRSMKNRMMTTPDITVDFGTAF